MPRYATVRLDAARAARKASAQSQGSESGVSCVRSSGARNARQGRCPALAANVMRTEPYAAPYRTPLG
jgi:hypothetical protein